MQDENTRQDVLAAYDAKHGLIKDATGRTFITVGSDDFPVAIPIVEKDGAWKFDTVAGREEILYRRIGRNELATIQACLAYVDAQNEYAVLAPPAVSGSMHSGSSAAPAKRTASIGRPRRVARRVRSARQLLPRQPAAIALVARVRPSTATTSRF